MTTLKVLATGSKGNCYLLESDGKILILDAGIPVQDIRRGMNYDTRHVVGCVVSHGHGDHLKGASGLEVMGIHVFKPYLSEMERRVVTYDGFVIQSFPLPHDGVENRGFLIKCPNNYKFLYMSDMSYCPYVFKEQRINTLLIECNYCKSMIDPDEEKYNHVLKGHASLDVAKEIVRVNKTSDLKNVILCHLSHNSADKYEILEEIRSVVDVSVLVTVAEPGLILDLDREF